MSAPAQGPYLVTTHRLGRQAGDVYYRRAVATLDEARETIETQIRSAGWCVPYGQIEAALQKGGTVGPLPGRVTITVARRRHSELIDELRNLDWHRFNNYMATHLRSAHTGDGTTRRELCFQLNAAWAEQSGAAQAVPS